MTLHCDYLILKPWIFGFEADIVFSSSIRQVSLTSFSNIRHRNPGGMKWAMDEEKGSSFAWT
jgi:hypothetical protein